MRTVLFDFDGTLADSFTVVVDIFYDLTKHPRIEEEDRIKQLRRLPIAKVVKELHIPPIQIPRLLMKGRKMMSERMDGVQPFPGIAEALAALHREDVVVCIMSSNSKQNVQQFLDAHHLSAYVTKVYGNIGLLNKAGAIKKVIRHNGLQPRDCVYVGDEVRDIEGAHRAGVKVIAVGWGYNDPHLLQNSHPDALVYQPKELVESIKNI